MIALLGDGSDSLLCAVKRRLEAESDNVVHVSEQELFTAPFAAGWGGPSCTGFVRLAGADVPFSDVQAVLVRLPRAWWPSRNLHPQDQHFVYHETTAAWVSVIAQLTCPIVNRFALDWWLHDLTHWDQLRREVATVLGLTAVEMGFDEGSPLRMRVPPKPSASMYVAGSQVFARNEHGRATADLVRSRLDSLRRWQAATGIHLSRLDLTIDDKPEVQWLEMFPGFDAEPPELVSELATATAGLLG